MGLGGRTSMANLFPCPEALHTRAFGVFIEPSLHRRVDSILGHPAIDPTSSRLCLPRKSGGGTESFKSPVEVDSPHKQLPSLGAFQVTSLT